MQTLCVCGGGRGRREDSEGLASVKSVSGAPPGNRCDTTGSEEGELAASLGSGRPEGRKEGAAGVGEDQG